MKYTGLAVLKLILSVELAFAGSATPMKTHLEQVSATVNGQKFLAQTLRVRMPTDKMKTLVMDEIAIAPYNAPVKVASSIKIESKAQLNGTSYVAAVGEPLNRQDRAAAFALMQNQADFVRRSAPAAISSQIATYPTYSSAVPATSISYDFRPDSNSTRDIINRTTDSATANSNAAFAGIIAQENQNNLDAGRYAQALQQGKNVSLQLQAEAAQSNFTFTQSLNNFSLSLNSLQDKQIENLAQQIAQADPVLENILSDDETDTYSDVRRATADVSPLNPNASDNLKRYGERFRSNGLLNKGLFNESKSFPATPAGHRLLESANLLSDAVSQDITLSTSTSSAQLVGASYVYLNAAMQAQAAGRVDEAARWTEEGRRITRALRGERVPDDIESAIASSDKAVALHEQAVRDTMGVSGEGRELLSQAFGKVQPTTAEGQEAAAIGRALVKDPHGISDADLKRVGLTLLDAALGMIPIVGPVKSLIYMVAGRNLITGEKLTTLDYILCAVDVLSLGMDGPFAKIAGKVPELMGLGGAGARVTEALKSGAGYVKNFGNFVEGSVKGIRDIEKAAPGFALKNFAQNPGAVLALGQNVTKYGGAGFAAELTTYAAKNSLSIVETAHVSSFAGGFTKLVTLENFAKYGTQAENLAGTGGGRFFAVATHDFEAASKGMSNNTQLASWIGMEGRAGESGFVRLDMEFDLKLNPRLPDGAEAGANQFFQTGGKTSGGAREIVLDPLPMSKVNVRGNVEL
jgi:hypothetical protein